MIRFGKVLAPAVVLLSLGASGVNVASALDLPTVQSASDWYTEGEQTVADKVAATTPETTAKNIILFVGDGMGVSTLTASRIYEGQLDSNPGEENYLSFEQFPHTALVKTYNTNQQTPDSAGTMTAMMSGVKTKAGVIGYAPSTIRANCGSTVGANLTTALELAEYKGMATGVVSTARITHATPAATYAHSPDRNWEDDGSLPDEAVERGCADIASQLVDFPFGDGIEVALGGGRRHFLTEADGGRRVARDLTSEWAGTYVADKAGLDAFDETSGEHLLGLFTSSHMSYEADRPDTEPSIADMTSKAIDVLEQDEDGFFLMVEAGRIDHAHHAGNAYRALEDTVAFSDAIAAATAKVDLSETLIIVTADHSHVFTIAGYPTRGNPILGLVDTGIGADDLPYTTLGYANGPGALNSSVEYLGDRDGSRVDLTSVDTTDPSFLQEAMVPLSSETHAGEDITVHATGPGSQWFSGGTIEQNVIFHVMNAAGNLGGSRK